MQKKKIILIVLMVITLTVLTLVPAKQAQAQEGIAPGWLIMMGDVPGCLCDFMPVECYCVHPK